MLGTQTQIYYCNLLMGVHYKNFYSVTKTFNELKILNKYPIINGSIFFFFSFFFSVKFSRLNFFINDSKTIYDWLRSLDWNFSIIFKDLLQKLGVLFSLILSMTSMHWLHCILIGTLVSTFDRQFSISYDTKLITIYR